MAQADAPNAVGADSPSKPKPEFKMDPVVTDLTESIGEVQAFFASVTKKSSVTFEKKLICHLCHKPGDGLCLKFGPDCSHAYCKNHVLSRFARSIESLQKAGPSLKLQCPVCSCVCECKSCEKKLKAKAKKHEEYKRKGQASKFEEIEKAILLKRDKASNTPTGTNKRGRGKGIQQGGGKRRRTEVRS